jgi:hypothetical protein
MEPCILVSVCEIKRQRDKRGKTRRDAEALRHFKKIDTPAASAIEKLNLYLSEKKFEGGVKRGASSSRGDNQRHPPARSIGGEPKHAPQAARKSHVAGGKKHGSGRDARRLEDHLTRLLGESQAGNWKGGSMSARGVRGEIATRVSSTQTPAGETRRDRAHDASNALPSQEPRISRALSRSTRESSGSPTHRKQTLRLGQTTLGFVHSPAPPSGREKPGGGGSLRGYSTAR